MSDVGIIYRCQCIDEIDTDTQPLTPFTIHIHAYTGDGELDDAEMALRRMDKSHKGTLSKEQMYELMSENLRTQRDLFKVKKVVIG